MAAARPLAARAQLEKAFDDAVFERMKTDHRQKPAGGKGALGGGKPLFKLAEFIVDRDADRLKAAGGRVALTGFRARQAGTA